VADGRGELAAKRGENAQKRKQLPAFRLEQRYELGFLRFGEGHAAISTFMR
jgi:hypothetical protein